MTNNKIFNKNKVDMTKKFNKIFKGDVDMTNKLNCIKKGAKYIIGAAVLATSLSSAAFGLDKDNNNYYQICNEKDLREFAELVNSGKECDAKGKLMNDIDLDCKNFGEWIPIGTDNSPFQGELISNDDNNNKKITGLYINKEDNDFQGLFGCVDTEGKVENIMVENAVMYGKDYIGGIAGYNKGTIIKCYADNSIGGNNNVGGIIGLNEGTMIGAWCNKNGAVAGEENVGGIVGNNKGTIKGTCINEGLVKGFFQVGGIVGDNSGTMLEESWYSNSGEVIGRDERRWDSKELRLNSKRVGGNIGYNSGKIAGYCVNTGKVKGEYVVGGNIGFNIGEIEECENREEVKGIWKVGGNVGANGDIFEFLRVVEVKGTIKKCKNSGNVIGNTYIGGNVGESVGIINNCENSGKIIGIYYVGGNVGICGGTIENCNNEGEVRGKEDIGGNIGNELQNIQKNNLNNKVKVKYCK